MVTCDYTRVEVGVGVGENNLLIKKMQIVIQI